MDKNDILRLLKNSAPGFVSGENLAAAMGVSRTAVWKQIRVLEREGFGIEAVPSKGYRLTASPDIIDRGEVVRLLGGRLIGSEIYYLSQTESTNSLALELARKGATEGTVVIAEKQTGGRGRLGRTWQSPAGNLYLSVVLRPAVPMSSAPLVTLMGAVAVASAIRRHLCIEAGIKWPNDILLAGRKVAGLLTEMSAEPDRIRHIVLGIGVNVNMDVSALPSEVRNTAMTLAHAAARPVDRTILLGEILHALDEWYERFQRGTDDVLTGWRNLNVTLGNPVTVRGSAEMITGLAADVDREGRLIVQTDDGALHPVAAGDVTIMRKAV